eukprot:10640272-Lingulodinium_polyedra.AAC.1
MRSCWSPGEPTPIPSTLAATLRHSRDDGETLGLGGRRGRRHCHRPGLGNEAPAYFFSVLQGQKHELPHD